MFQFIKRKGNEAKSYSKKILQTDKIIEQSDEIKKMAHQIFDVKDKIANAKVETFNDATKRLNLDDLDLLIQRRQLANLFYISFILVFIILIISMYFFIYAHQLISGFMAITVMGICLANCFKFSFRYFQIKHKVLCPVSDWFNTKNEWMPSPVTEDDIFKLKSQVRKQKALLKKQEELVNLQNLEDEKAILENHQRQLKEKDEELANYFKEKEIRKKQNQEYLDSLSRKYNKE